MIRHRIAAVRAVALALLLAVLLPAALAEGWTAEPAAFDADATIAAAPAEWVDEPVEEYELELGPTDLEAAESLPEEAPAIAAPVESAAEPAAGDTAAQPGEAGAEQAPEEATPSYGEALQPRKLTISKSCSRTVYMGVPYVIAVKGKTIKKCASKTSSVATASKNGALTLKKPGKTKITVTTTSGKKLVLKLTVAPVPAPKSAEVSAKKKSIVLSWEKAGFATGYLVQHSTDEGDTWTDLSVLSADSTSLDITDAVTGPVLVRVAALLGDAPGGACDPISVLGPVADLRVICEETFNAGPSNRMNVAWTASPGATGYEVYRATLPSDEYELLGTTGECWYPDTRTPTELYAYRVRPVREGMDELPISEPVTLWSGLDDNVLPPKKLKSDTGIILVVNKQAQVVTAYVRDADGRYAIPLRHMICSTGLVYDSTKNGTYTLKARGGEWHHYSSTNTYIRWPSIYRSGYYFHSPLYHGDKSINGSAVKRLGKRGSQGCIRLTVRDAKWVYDYCGAGTAVYICDGKKLPNLNKALKAKKVEVKGF